MTEERYVTLDAVLPADPKPNEVVEIPPEQVGGASTLTFVYVGGNCVGYSSQYARVTNVSAHSFLARTVTSIPLHEGTIIQVIGEQFTFKSLQFVEYFGWTVKDYNPKPEILLNETFKVLYAAPLHKNNSDLYVYDRVCMVKYQEDRHD